MKNIKIWKIGQEDNFYCIHHLEIQKIHNLESMSHDILSTIWWKFSNWIYFQLQNAIAENKRHRWFNQFKIESIMSI